MDNQRNMLLNPQNWISEMRMTSSWNEGGTAVYIALRWLGLSLFFWRWVLKTFQLKQELWSLGGRFNISDEAGMPHYQCEGSLFRVPKRFTITDMQGNLVSQIEKIFLSFLPTFKVNLACGESFTLRKEWTLFKPRYQIENLNMIIQGDFWNLDFDLEKDGQVLARISQEWLRLTSTYNIEVYDESYADLVISLVVAIDYVKAMEANSSNGS